MSKGTTGAPENDREARRATAGSVFVRELVQMRSYLWSHANALTRHQSEADDLVHDTLERALTCEHLFRPGTNLKAWLHSIMRNIFIDGWRRNAAHVLVDVDWFQNNLAAPGPAERGPLDAFDFDDVMAAVAALSLRDRELFRLAHVERLPYREIGKRYRIPIETVGSRLFRIRQRLRPLLEAALAK